MYDPGIVSGLMRSKGLFLLKYEELCTGRAAYKFASGRKADDSSTDDDYIEASIRHRISMVVGDDEIVMRAGPAMAMIYAELELRAQFSKSLQLK